MAVNNTRSQRRSLLDGATDGKYRKARPDTEVIPGTGGEHMAHDRSHLHAPWNYGFPVDETPLEQRSIPGLP